MYLSVEGCVIMSVVWHVASLYTQVTVEAGMKLKELVSYLDENGLALGNLPAITEQSIAGCLSTG